MKVTTKTEAEIDAVDLMGKVTITVVVKRMWRVRLGVWLMALGARICGAKIEFYDEDECK